MYIYFEELDENKGAAKLEYNENVCSEIRNFGVILSELDGRGHSLDFIDLLWKESSII